MIGTMMPPAFRAFLAGVAIVAAALFRAAAAKSYDVGGPTGSWDLSTNFQAWTSGKSFHTGDNLIFIYDSTHDVVEVTKSDYDSCTVTTPIQAYADGNTVISLKPSGMRYFLCSIPGHCDAGMKIKIDVVAASPDSTLATMANSSAPAPAPAPKTKSPAPAPAPAPKTKSPAPAPKVKSPVPAPKSKSPAPAPKSKSPALAPKAKSPPPKHASPRLAPAPVPSSLISIAPSPYAAPEPAPSAAAVHGGRKLVRAAATVGIGLMVALAF